MEKPIKHSVRLPKTDFAMKANLNVLEAEVIKNWEESNIYKQVMEKNSNNTNFILHDGPPYANGNLHVGHALNKILKDMLVKSYMVRGYRTPFVLGWDCHGLPIEWKIEEKYKNKGISKEEINVESFRKECYDFAHKWIDIQKAEFKTLGVMADYDNSYVTTAFAAEVTIVSSILKLLQEGVLYQGKKPVLWSVVEKTALAEAEVEYKDKISDAFFVGLKVFEANTRSPALWRDARAVIWTTTPWTLPSNQAVAYSKSVTYGLYETTALADSIVRQGLKLIVATDLAENLFKQIKVGAKKLDEQVGLEDFKFSHPLYGVDEFYNKTVPALAGDFVETTVGSGLVHVAPSHGEDDFYLCKQNAITPVELVQDDGVFSATTPIFAGEHIFKVNDKIAEKLLEAGALLSADKLLHSYPHSWRSKAPLIYRLTTQWFISLDKSDVRKRAIESLDTIDFFPKTGKNRLSAMLEGRPDWCISRQRSWGVPLGIFINNQTKKPLIDDEVFTNILDAFAKDGSNSWFKEDPRRFLGQKYNHDDYTPVMDVVDVWIDSGLTHDYVLKQNKNLSFPADVYLEGSDQHRGWFQSSLVMSLLISGVPPYKKVITHGFIMDDNGQKMSKSIGNVITPAQIIKEYGADILRLWVASVNVAEDVNLGKNILTQQSESYRKIRNTLRYLIANLSYYNEAMEGQPYSEIDLWILHNMYCLDELFEQTFTNTFTIHLFYNKVFSFILNDLSAFYFDIKKDTLYCDASNSPVFMATLSVMNKMFNLMLKWLSPIIPFTMEEAYAKRYSKPLGSLFIFDFPKADKLWYNEEIFNRWERIKKIRKVVTGALEQKRANKEIGSSLEAAPIVYLNYDDQKLLEKVDFADVCITSEIVIEDFSKLSNEEVYQLGEIGEVAVKFAKAEGDKCERCWRIFKHVDTNCLCSRCSNAITGE